MTTTMEPPAQEAPATAEVEEEPVDPEDLAMQIDRTELLPIPPVEIVRDSGVHAEVVKMTPDVARALLTHRRFQREVSWATVRKYVRDMQAGHWALTGQPMILSGADGWEIRDDHLYLRDDKGGYDEIEAEDMQHRLLAIVISGATISVLFVWGVSPSVRPLIDLNKIRTLPDVLNYATELGIKAGSINTVTLAKVAKRYAQIEQLWRGERPLTPTIPESMSWLYENVEMIESVQLAEEYREDLPSLAKPDIAALVGYHLRRVFGEEAERDFITKFATQAGLPERHPYLVASKRLEKMGAKNNKVPRGTWRDQFGVVLNAASLSLADKHPVSEAQVATKPRGRSIPAPLVAEAHLAAVEE